MTNTTIQELKTLNLISGDAVCNIFKNHYLDIFSLNAPWCLNMKTLWSRKQNWNNNNNTLNGKVFEGLIACIMYKASILPLFVQAKMSFIPNIEFDFIGYSKEYGPVILSLKTSLRERYKQADLEGMMLKQVHRNAKSYLLTLSSNEAKSVNQKIINGEVLGIDKVIDVTTNDFDNLLNELQKLDFYIPDKIKIITGNKIITKPF